MKTWEKIILHHSQSKDGTTNDWEGIRKYHMSYRIDYQIVSEKEYLERSAIHSGTKFEIPWPDIGYHFGIESINGIYVLRLGRSLEKNGCHTIGQNDMAIGICCVGNFDNNPPPEELYDKCAFLCKILMQIFNIPVNEIHGHREFAEKTCPGKLFDIEELKKRI